MIRIVDIESIILSCFLNVDLLYYLYSRWGVIDNGGMYNDYD